MFKELFEDDDGALVSDTGWRDGVSILRSDLVALSDSALDLALVESVRRRSDGKIALLLSGGVDSSLLAVLLKKLGANFRSFCVGLPDSPDMDWSARLAAHLDIPLERVIIRSDEVEGIIDSLRPLLKDCVYPGQNLSVLFGVSAVEWAGLDAISRAGFKTVMGGLGSEEIFAGYSRHGLAKDINAECWSGLESMWGRDLVRDSILASRFNIRLSTPFLDPDLIRVAMAIPGEKKIVGDMKKYCLREAAVRLGLPREFAFRPKQAAQYGSYIDKAIERIMRKNGFKKKFEYLSSRY
ncbi:MAG: asparagine synthase C-terminal domain-containing protein [Nanoarchaeota archaeon]